MAIKDGTSEMFSIIDKLPQTWVTLINQKSNLVFSEKTDIKVVQFWIFLLNFLHLPKKKEKKKSICTTKEVSKGNSGALYYLKTLREKVSYETHVMSGNAGNKTNKHGKNW